MSTLAALVFGRKLPMFGTNGCAGKVFALKKAPPLFTSACSNSRYEIPSCGSTRRVNVPDIRMPILLSVINRIRSLITSFIEDLPRSAPSKELAALVVAA
jgi:hypothetical protein